MTRIAECACGAFKVKAEGEPLMVAACNCTQCQKRTGSVFGVGAYFPEDSVQVVSGAFQTFKRSGDQGTTWSIHFCPICGSSVFWEGPFFLGVRAVAVGCLADPGFAAPQFAVFTENQRSWVSFPAGATLLQTAVSQEEAAALLDQLRSAKEQSLPRSN
jgi:hypothetical protein